MAARRSAAQRAAVRKHSAESHPADLHISGRRLGNDAVEPKAARPASGCFPSVRAPARAAGVITTRRANRPAAWGWPRAASRRDS